MLNWKTTVLGILIAAAGGVASANHGTPIGQAAEIIAYIATGALGVFAKDHDATGGTRS